MNKIIPDKWVRKAIYDAINDMVVDSVTIPCFDMRVPASNKSSAYVLITTQTNREIKANKCEYEWESSVLLDIVTLYNATGNPGSRLFADNIADTVRDLCQGLTLDAASGLKITDQRIIIEPDLVSFTDTQNVFRKLIRYELTIK